MEPEQVQQLWELFERERGPVEVALRKLTPKQYSALSSSSTYSIISGGNQSGKTFTACVFAAAYGLNKHPNMKWKKPPCIWYCTTTYEQFSKQPFKHLENLLLFEGESFHKTPTRYVASVIWVGPGKPKSIKLNNGTEIVVKSFDQGEGEFQSMTLDVAIVDEECPSRIWDEIQARFLASVNPKVIVAATPIRGEAWLEEMKDRARANDPTVSLYQLKTTENPASNTEFIASLIEKYKYRPEELKLRLEGIPFHSQGLVYPDEIFTPDHVCEPFKLNPGEWTLYRCLDHGYRFCACLWLAVNHRGEMVIYRDYMGKSTMLSENAKIIAELSKGELYADTYIDPATLGRSSESGERIIDLWWDAGIDAYPAPDNSVLSGIERVKDALCERDALGIPRVRVFRTCTEFLRERQGYRWQPSREDGDQKKDMPTKREDHVMDCFRYLITAEPHFHIVKPAMPPPDTLGYKFWKQRNPEPKFKL